MRRLFLLTLLLVSLWGVTGTDSTPNGNANDSTTDKKMKDPSSLLKFPGTKDQPLVMDVAGDDCGVPQVVDPLYYQAILETIQIGRGYLEDWVKRDDFYEPVVQADLCRNKHELCGLWATLGECFNNPNYMRTACPVVCKSCEEMHMETKCPIPERISNEESATGGSDVSVAWKPGDLDKTFERITTDPTLQKKYDITVLSKPLEYFADSDEEYDDEKEDIATGFWAVLLDNFLTPEECQHIIQLGHDAGFNRSSTMEQVGTFSQKVSTDRTSENAWCTGPCYQDPIVQTVLQKMYNVTQLHDNHAEYLQILKYEPQQCYKSHIDYIPAQKKRVQGVRILTLFLYLSNVEQGGGTYFPQMDLTVMPRQGRALIWPSVLNEAPNNMDSRTEHEALPVIRGIKYGANAWYHMRDFKTPHAKGCG